MPFNKSKKWGLRTIFGSEDSRNSSNPSEQAEQVADQAADVWQEERKDLRCDVSMEGIEEAQGVQDFF